MCDPKFLNNEFYYVWNSFKQLQYPKYFIQRAKTKAFEIHKHICTLEI